MKLELRKVRHPLYTESIDDWNKCRAVYDGGDDFINSYLVEFSKREDEDDFKRRKKLTYNPGFASTIVDEIKNSIYLRMPEITRKGGDKTYQEAILGKNGGVDLKGCSLNNFIGQYVLPELLITSMVGVYVDMPNVNLQTLGDVVITGAKPYLYYYEAEQIYSWNSYWYEGEQVLTSLLLHETYDAVEEDLVVGREERLRKLTLKPDGVLIEFYSTEEDKKIAPDVFLKGMKRLPFIMAGITKSILRDIANYQIALLNIESSDLAYILDANFTFYVEPYDPRTEPIHFPQGDVTQPTLAEGEMPAPPAQTEKARDLSVKGGPTNGRRFPKDAQPPAFINPSSEPLKASMDKQAQMKNDMRKLANLALTSVEPKFASAESKQMDDRSLESGLSYIGLELERLERMIGEVWNYYMNGPEISVKYPKKYSLKTDKDRREDAKANSELATSVPSKTFAKEMCKANVRLLLEQKVGDDTLAKIEKEIDSAEYLTASAEEIAKDVEIGIVDKVTASNARGYNGEKVVPIAEKEHTKRLAEIAAAQAPSGTDPSNPGAKEQKDLSQNSDTNPDSTKQTRGTAN